MTLGYKVTRQILHLTGAICFKSVTLVTTASDIYYSHCVNTCSTLLHMTTYS